MNPFKNNKVIFVFFTILLDAIGIGILIPVLPDVIRRFTSDPVLVATYFGYFIGVYALMQFFSAPVLGALSDRFGRKPILLTSLCGAAVDYVLMAFSPSMWILFIGRLISGLTGASITVASSYMADISDDTNRSANFGLIGAGWGVGFILGPLLGGLFGILGPKAPFIAAAILNACNFLFGVLVLPESLSVVNRRQVAISSLNPFKSVVHVVRPSAIRLLVVIYFLVFLAGQVHPVNWTLYTQTKFGWTPWQVGLSMTFVGMTIAFSHGVLTRWLIPKWGEPRSVVIGLVGYVISFFTLGVISRAWMVIPAMLLFSISGITIPAVQSIIARHVPSNEQGELQGSLVSLGSLSAILAPPIFTSLFVHFTSKPTSLYFPGAAYVGASGVCGVALAVWLVKRRSDR